jgi:hypothetical protein
MGVKQGVKQPGHETDYSSLHSNKFKSGEAIHSLPHTSSWHSVELLKHRGCNCVEAQTITVSAIMEGQCTISLTPIP